MRDDDTRDGTCGVPFEGYCGFIYSTKGDLGGQVHGCNGFVAPTDWSGRFQAGAGLVLQHLYELSVLFSGGSAPSGVVPLPLHSLLEQYGSDWGVMSCDGCSYCGTLIDCWAAAPGYVTFISDLHYGMPLALSVSSILSCHMFIVDNSFCCPMSLWGNSLFLGMVV